MHRDTAAPSQGVLYEGAATQMSSFRFDSLEEVISVGFFEPHSHDEVDKAIDAVRDGLADQKQRDMVKEAAAQSGSRGKRALAAIQNRR